ncbi:MAG TPA: SDR family NAD(P)-dependent oxidoreductase [Clostridia bacterium]|nr:SDR family NAD(P)-dependent oxidoreductase [Clostridia bacterium]
MRLENKIVVLTGASSGIGYSVAKQFAREGATVIAMARRANKLEELKESTLDLAGKVIPMQGDVVSQEDVDRVVKSTLEEFGRIDVLINNAGIIDNYQSAGSVEDETWQKVIDVNVTGIMRMTRAVIPSMVENKSGVILNTTSVGGFNGMRGGLAYVATKHAVVGMSKNIGYTYQQDGIRCVAIAPGTYDTEIGTHATAPDMKTLNHLMAGFKLFPHSGNPDDLAHLYVFLASDEAKFINGTLVVSDGGWTAF